MATRTTFADLAGRKLELVVVCQKCGHESVIDGTASKLRDRPIAGQRFRCSVERDGAVCGGIGLPTMRTRQGWTPPPRPEPPPISPPSRVARTRGQDVTESIDTSRLVGPARQGIRKRSD